MRLTKTTIQGALVPLASAPPLSSVGSMTFYANTDGMAYLSIGGGAYASIQTGANAGWDRDAALVPPQIEPLVPTDVLAFSTADLDTPAGTKIFFEHTPAAVFGATLLATMTGEQDEAAAIGAWLIRVAGLGAGEIISCYQAELDDNAADNATSVVAGLRMVINTQNGAGSYRGLVMVGNSDGGGGALDRLIQVTDSPAIIEAGNVSAALGAPDITIRTILALAGDTSGALVLQTGNSDTQAANISLLPGVDTVGGNHATALIEASDPAQTPLTVKGDGAQTAVLTNWVNSLDQAMTSIDDDGNVINQRGSGAGANSTMLLQRCQTSAVTDEWQQLADGEVATDVSHRRIYDPDANLVFEITRSRVGAPFTSVAFLGGPGAQSVTRPAQITDNTTGTSAANAVQVPAVGGSGATAAQEAAIDDNFATLIARINALELMLFNQGFFT